MIEEHPRPVTGGDYYRGRHRRRAGRVQLVIEHAQPSRRPRRARVALITGAIVLAVSGGVVAYATPAPVVSQPAATVTAPTTAPAAAPTRPVPEAEMVYLEELRFGGLKLSEAEQKIAVEIAREHVAHGHLNGMRYEITDDFFYRIPRLTTEERDIARIAVEHHFQQVTGRKQ